MSTSTLEQTQRANVRNFLLTADRKQVRQELVLSLDREDIFRAKCCLEVLIEMMELPRNGGTLHDLVKLHDWSVVGGDVVTVHAYHVDMFNVTDFVVVEANSHWTKLMHDPNAEIACCSTCGWLGCQSACSEYSS